MDDQKIPRIGYGSGTFTRSDQRRYPEPAGMKISACREQIRAMEKNMKCLHKDKKELIKEIEKMEFIESSREE